MSARWQALLPQRALSALAGRIAKSRHPWIKDRLIRLAIRRFGIDLAEAESADPAHYPSFDAFFTRALAPGARRPDPDPCAWLAPADGLLLSAGALDPERRIRAKGHDYPLDRLLASRELAAAFEGGLELTIYLAPRDYHRVHMPADGRLLGAVHVPGRLFSVAPAAAASIPGLFARNERLVCHFEGPLGRFAVVMVAALLVGGIETVFAGRIAPPHPRRPRELAPATPLVLERFAELGRFHYGSTVILLLPPGATILPTAVAGRRCRVGEALARAQAIPASPPASPPGR